jgi:predicted dehydrogenase
MNVKKVHPVRIGIIGLGGMSEHHIRQLSLAGGAEVTAVCDVNGEALKRVGEALAVPEEKRYSDFAALVADGDVDAVLSVTPNRQHADIMEACIRQGKAVMSEKPFTRTLEEAERLRPLYEKHPVPCMIGFSYRYVPSFRYAKQLLREAKLGTIRHVNVHYLQQWGAPGFETPFSWRFSREESGSGALGDLGAHMIDAARFFAGEIEAVCGVMKTIVPMRHDRASGESRAVDVDDFASFQALFADGAVGTFATSRNAVGSGNQLEVSVYGEAGTLHVACERPDEIRLCVLDAETKQTPFRTLQVPEQFRRNQLQDFLDAARGEKPQDMPGFADGYMNQLIIEAVIESARRGAFVAVGAGGK